MNCQLYKATCSFSHCPKGSKNPDGDLGGRKRKRGLTNEQSHQDRELPAPVPESVPEPTHWENNTEQNNTAQRVHTPLPWSSTDEPEIAPLFQTNDMTADFDQYAHDLGLVLAPSWPPNPLSSLSFHDLDVTEDPGAVSSISPYPTHLPTPRLSHVGPSSSVFQSIDTGHTANPGPFASTSHQRPTGLPHARSAHGLFLRQGPTNSKFIGIGSVGSTLSECLRYSINSHGGSMEDAILNHLVNGIRHVDEIGLSAAFERPPLPERDFAERGILAYYNCLHPLYPVMEENFLDEWYQIYEDSNYALYPVTYSRFCLLVSVGNLVSPSRWDTDTWETARRLQEQTWSLIDRVMASPYMESMQVMLLHSIFLLYCGKTGIAWVTCGMAVRIAQSLGLHQATPPQLKLSAEDIGLRSRLWSVAYTLDAFLSLSEGRPSAIAGSPNVGLSHRSSEQERTAVTAKAPAIPVHDWLVSLAVITNEVTALLNNGESLVGTLAQIAEIDAKLLAWKDAVPMESRPDQQILSDGSLHYMVAMLHLKYHNLMRTLHWISLNLSSEEIGDDFPRLGARVRSSESICSNSARSVIEVLNGASSRAIGGRLGGFVVPYCMAAISIFYWQILKDPTRHSARTNLEHMRNGTLHITTLLNGIGPKRHFRALFEEMLRIAENVVSKAPAQSINLQQEETIL